MSKFNTWEVYNKGRWIDTVFFQPSCDEQYVRDSLINHDGYPSSITLRLR